MVAHISVLLMGVSRQSILPVNAFRFIEGGRESGSVIGWGADIATLFREDSLRRFLLFLVDPRRRVLCGENMSSVRSEAA